MSKLAKVFATFTAVSALNDDLWDGPRSMFVFAFLIDATRAVITFMNSAFTNVRKRLRRSRISTVIESASVKLAFVPVLAFYILWWMPELASRTSTFTSEFAISFLHPDNLVQGLIQTIIFNFFANFALGAIHPYPAL